MLAHCGDYEERCQHLETLKNRLEAMLSTQLVSAFNTHSLGEYRKDEIFLESSDMLLSYRILFYFL